MEKGGGMGSMQKAWVYKEYGAVDNVLELGEFPIPQITSPDEVLIKVMAAALNPVDYKRRLGLFAHCDSPLPHVPGYDVAGMVVKVGAHVSKFKEGDKVYGDVSEHALMQPKRCGTLAQYTLAEERLLAHKPENLSFVDAAALPLALETAQEAFDRVEFQPGQTVFIIGGAGGVGTLAIQLAKVIYGASHVTTTISTAKIEFVKSLGADTVIDYTTQNYVELPEKYDFVFDTVGEVEKAVKVVKEGGNVASIAAFGVLPEPAFSFVLTSNGANLAKLTPYFESGKLKPILDPKSPFKFSEVREAFKYLETGKAVGKLVISPID